MKLLILLLCFSSAFAFAEIPEDGGCLSIGQGKKAYVYCGPISEGVSTEHLRIRPSGAVYLKFDKPMVEGEVPFELAIEGGETIRATGMKYKSYLVFGDYASKVLTEALQSGEIKKVTIKLQGNEHHISVFGYQHAMTKIQTEDVQTLVTQE